MSSTATMSPKAGMGLGIFVLCAVVVVGVVAFCVWGVPAIRRRMMMKKRPRFHPTTGPNQQAIGPQLPAAVSGAAAPSPYALDEMAAGRRRSNRATGYSADTSLACYDENLIGAQQFATSQKGGNVACSFPSSPMGSKAVPLGSAATGGALLTTPIDLSNYARMGSDRSLSAVGLDAPEDLALASAQLGHLEFAGSTRMDTWDTRGTFILISIASKELNTHMFRRRNSHELGTEVYTRFYWQIATWSRRSDSRWSLRSLSARSAPVRNNTSRSIQTQC